MQELNKKEIRLLVMEFLKLLFEVVKLVIAATALVQLIRGLLFGNKHWVAQAAFAFLITITNSLVELWLLLDRSYNPLRHDYLFIVQEAKRRGGRRKLRRERNFLLFSIAICLFLLFISIWKM